MTHFVTFFYFGERLALCVFMFVCPRVCVCVSSKKKILPHPRLVSYVKETVFISVLDDLTVTLEKKLHISQVIFFFLMVSYFSISSVSLNLYPEDCRDTFSDILTILAVHH